MTGFSRRPLDVEAARGFLIDVARDPGAELPTYGRLASAYGGIARGAGPVLNSIARDCDRAGEPDLTALVVDGGTHLPGTFKGRPVEAGSPNETQWQQELVRIRGHAWKRPTK
jgi:hypothetical protein